MKKFFFILLFCFSSFVLLAQSETELAYQYYRDGEYEKALVYFKKLHQLHPHNENYFKNLLTCYKQLEQFSEAENVAKKQLQTYPEYYPFYVYLGIIYAQQKQQEKAEECYKKALLGIEKKPHLAYSVGRIFTNNHLLDKALLTYTTAMKHNDKQDFYFRIAQIYAEKSELKKMFEAYLNGIEKTKGSISTAKRYMGSFITNDNENANNVILKKLLLKRLQNNPQMYWNDLLSWLFIQQHDYFKAFIQQKAMFNRNPTNLRKIKNLGTIAFEYNDYATAKSCFEFVIKNTSDLEQKLKAEIQLVHIDIATTQKNKNIHQKFQQLFTTYGKNKNTIDLQIAYANFLTFQQNDPNKAIEVLKEADKLPVSLFVKGKIKNKLADILVFTNQFNSALIYYTQVQNELENNPIAQESRYKIAQTSYFKGDFKWANAQVKVLKGATSKLIANDALELFLLISNNMEKDSTHINLKKYAKAQLLAFQNKNQQAINTLQDLLPLSKGKLIEDDALYQQAKLFEKEKQFKKAAQNYLRITTLNETMLKDDAFYRLAELHLNHLKDKNKAQEYYKKIVFDFPSSIYLVDARKKYRSLKNENTNPL